MNMSVEELLKDPFFKVLYDVLIPALGTKVLELIFSKHTPGPGNLIDDDGGAEWELARQRFYHRVVLARVTWNLLKLSTYYHPTMGRSAASSGTCG